MVLIAGLAAATALVAGGTAVAHASPVSHHHAISRTGPLIPGCGGGDWLVIANNNTNLGWKGISMPPNTFLGVVSPITGSWCAMASGGWQEIKDAGDGLCVGMDGLSAIYEKPCNGRDFELFSSGGSPVTALIIVSKYVDENEAACSGGLSRALSNNGASGDLVFPDCPRGGGTTYTSSQTWNMSNGV